MAENNMLNDLEKNTYKYNTLDISSFNETLKSILKRDSPTSYTVYTGLLGKMQLDAHMFNIFNNPTKCCNASFDVKKTRTGYNFVCTKCKKYVKQP